MTAGSNAQLANALASINSEPQAFYSHFVIYEPTGAPAGYGLPQPFIAESSTPEPWPLLMLGTGLLALWGGKRLKVYSR
jgi:hypothetical protein